MAEGARQSVQQLYLQWRAGDRAAGQTMAQMFSDWYYAITTVHLGDQRGREPLAAACDRFIKGIATVPGPAELVDWAYGLVRQELEAVGARIPGGDFPNALTQNRSPKELLAQARGGMDPGRVRLLALTYDRAVPIEDVVAEAEALGGMPHAILDARHQLKKWLGANAQVPFSILPDDPDLDLAPLPIYEAGRMASADEEGQFERWLVSDIDLCKDVAEFAAFAHALRAGAFALALQPGGMEALARVRARADAERAVAAHPATQTFASAARPEGDDARPSSPLLAIGLVLLAVLSALVVIVVLFFFVLE